MELLSKQTELAGSISKKFLCYCQQLLPTAAQCGISLDIPLPDLADPLRDEMTTAPWRGAWDELMTVQAKKEGEDSSALYAFRDMAEKILTEFVATLRDVYGFHVSVTLYPGFHGDLRVPEKKVYTWVDLYVNVRFDPLRLKGLSQLESFVIDFRG